MKNLKEDMQKRSIKLKMTCNKHSKIEDRYGHNSKYNFDLREVTKHVSSKIS
ncbi:MAG: hypothetical protein NPMRTH5_140002 [Nitrosopumilales archaeon]|nr:MAG: hypothetical protein NPMRTH5_140002 [Nitrosopumilales archaeon]